MLRRHLMLTLLLACASVHAAPPTDSATIVEHPVPADAPAGGWSSAAPNAADPWEGVNRRIHAFNDVADRWVLRPVASAYRNTTPDPVQRGVGNFFGNIGEIANLINNVLQGKLLAGANDGVRLLINSTIGVAGIFDIASRWGLPSSNEDFGQTLGAWGVSSGPYIVVPLLGPRTVRDGFGSVVDGYTDPVAYLDDDGARIALLGLRIVHGRAGLIPSEEMVTGDRYLFLRDAYLQRRQFLVNDGVVEDDFGAEDDDWPEWE